MSDYIAVELSTYICLRVANKTAFVCVNINKEI